MRNNLSQLISLNYTAEGLYRPANAYELTRVSRMEHLRTTIEKTANQAVKQVANRVATLIRLRQEEGKNFVLSLVAGRTMRDLFGELVRMHKEDNLSFSNVIIINSYEYFPLADASLGSMAQIQREFLNFVDIPAENIYNIPSNLSKESVIDFANNLSNALTTLEVLTYRF